MWPALRMKCECEGPPSAGWRNQIGRSSDERANTMRSRSPREASSRPPRSRTRSNTARAEKAAASNTSATARGPESVQMNQAASHARNKPVAGTARYAPRCDSGVEVTSVWLPNGSGAQLRPTAPPRPSEHQLLMPAGYQTTIGTRCWASAAAPSMLGNVLVRRRAFLSPSRTRGRLTTTPQGFASLH
jgi:hypothetical protein